MRTMSVSIEEDLYRLLKKTAGPRRMSRFISDALRARLRSRQKSLHQEYVAAGKDKNRQRVLGDWDAIDAEDWR